MIPNSVTSIGQRAFKGRTAGREKGWTITTQQMFEEEIVENSLENITCSYFFMLQLLITKKHVGVRSSWYDKISKLLIELSLLR